MLNQKTTTKVSEELNQILQTVGTAIYQQQAQAGQPGTESPEQPTGEPEKSDKNLVNQMTKRRRR